MNVAPTGMPLLRRPTGTLMAGNPAVAYREQCRSLRLTSIVAPLASKVASRMRVASGAVLER